MGYAESCMGARPPLPAETALIGNLRTIVAWLDAHEDFSPPLRSNDEFMAFSAEIMNFTTYLLRAGVSLCRAGEDRSGVSRNRAIVIGHLVRAMKLYECFVEHACANEGEICMIFHRLILETLIRLHYLISAPRASFKNFVLISYRPEKEHLADLKKKKSARPLTPIERRIIASIRKHLRMDRISQRELDQNRQWDLDNKNFRAILQDLGADSAYSYGFGNGSHFVHGDWRDISFHHLERRDGRYLPKPEYGIVDPRLTCRITTLCLDGIIEYFRWNRSDPDNYVRPIAARLIAINQRLDHAHEEYLQAFGRDSTP